MYKKQEIISEYNLSASKNTTEFQKVKWGSEQSMLNRFELAKMKIEFNNLVSFLDIGCGTGAFIRQITTKYNLKTIVGIDISDKLIEYCTINAVKNEKYICSDILEFDYNRYFDAITMIGILQKTNHDIELIFSKIFDLLEQNGLFFFTTKNLNWSKFKEPNFFPEKSHHWFNSSDLERVISKTGFSLVDKGGFLPNENKIVEMNDSHTIFYLLQK